MSWGVSVCDFTLFILCLHGCSRRVSNAKPDAFFYNESREDRSTKLSLPGAICERESHFWAARNEKPASVFPGFVSSKIKHQVLTVELHLRNSGLFPGGRISVVHKTSVGGVVGLWGQMFDWRKDQSFVSFVFDQFLRPSLLGFEAHHRTAICLCVEQVFLEVCRLLYSDSCFFKIYP